MNEKLNRKLWPVFCALLLIFVLQRGFLMLNNRPDRPLTGAFSFADATISSATSMAIRRGTEGLQLKNENQNWTVNNFKADQQKISSFLEDLQTAKALEQVSRSAGNLSEFGLSDDKAIELVIESPAGVSTFLIGDPGTNGSSFYARQKDNDKAYLFSGLLRGRLNENADYWRDHLIINIPSDTINSIEIQSAGGDISVQKAEDKWLKKQNGQDTEMTTEAMQTFLAALSPLNAASFASAEQVIEFEKAKKSQIKVVSLTADYVFELAETAGSWWVKLAGGETVFGITKVVAEQLMFINREEN